MPWLRLLKATFSTEFAGESSHRDCRHVFKRALDAMNLQSYGHGDFSVRFSTKSVYFNRAAASLCLLFLSVSIFGVALASEGVDRFWRDLGLSQDPDSLLREILSRSEFKESNWTWLSEALLRWLSERFRWLYDLILALLRKFFGRWNVNVEADTLWSAVGAFFAAVFVVGALLVLFHALKAFLHRKEDRPEMQPSFFAAVGQSSSETLRISRSMAERGEYRGALIHLFRYVLIRLDEQGRLGFYAGKTNREILRSPGLRLSDRKVLSEMIPIFNGVRYGDFPCGKSEYDRFLSLTGLLVEISEVS